MLRIVACLSLAVGVLACQPLYGSKPDKLATLPKKPPPKEEAAAEPPPPKMNEDCTASFQGDPAKVRQQIPQGRDFTASGDAAIANADKSSDPAEKVALIKDAIDRYSKALRADPYNATATLQLARAYDKVYKKGCAVALLKRLASLSTNSKFSKEANLLRDSVDDNAQWFKYYRKDAIAAIGH
jgi:hypothetical protein